MAREFGTAAVGFRDVSVTHSGRCVNVDSIHLEPAGEVGGGFPEGAHGAWSRSTAGWDRERKGVMTQIQ